MEAVLAVVAPRPLADHHATWPHAMTPSVRTRTARRVFGAGHCRTLVRVLLGSQVVDLKISGSQETLAAAYIPNRGAARPVASADGTWFLSEARIAATIVVGVGAICRFSENASGYGACCICSGPHLAQCGRARTYIMHRQILLGERTCAS
jgi:hypothetical protein